MPNDNLTMEGVRILFRNFAGKEGQYNREGDRNFAVLLDDDIAGILKADGWNVKQLRVREEDEDPHPQSYMSVAVNFKGRPPRITIITSRGRTNLGEGEVELLDWADISNVDLIVRPYEWVVSGKSGIKAYLQSIYVTIQEDALELKYADIREIGARELEAPQRLALEDGNIIEAEIVDE